MYPENNENLKYRVCIEDKVIPWPNETILAEEVAENGGWAISDGVIMVDREQNETTLKPGQVIELQPGITFGKKLCFKRGGFK